MKKASRIRFTILTAAAIVALVAFSVALFYLPGPPVSNGERGKSVAVTWGLLAEIVYRLGGGEISVIQLLPPGAEIHDWEPTPEAISAVSKSRLLVWTVEGLDDWAVRVAEAAGVRSFKASQDVKLLPVEIGDEHEHNHEDHAHPAVYDVHLWLSPLNVKQMVDNLARELALEFPELSQKIRQNAAQINEELDILHGEFSRKLAPYGGRVFITQHGAFRYLAETYGLQVLSVLGHEEEEPPAARLQEIVKRLKESCAIFAEDGFIHPLLESLSRDYGVKILMLYTGEGLNVEDVRQGKGYVYLMRLNLEALLEGLRCG